MMRKEWQVVFEENESYKTYAKPALNCSIKPQKVSIWNSLRILLSVNY